MKFSEKTLAKAASFLQANAKELGISDKQINQALGHYNKMSDKEKKKMTKGINVKKLLNSVDDED